MGATEKGVHATVRLGLNDSSGPSEVSKIPSAILEE